MLDRRIVAANYSPNGVVLSVRLTAPRPASEWNVADHGTSFRAAHKELGVEINLPFAAIDGGNISDSGNISRAAPRFKGIAISTIKLWLR